MPLAGGTHDAQLPPHQFLATRCLSGEQLFGQPKAVIEVVLARGLMTVLHEVEAARQGGEQGTLVAGSELPTLCVVGLMLFTACYFASAAQTQSDRLRIALTFAFGLVHGFGFAGILQELDLPSERLVPALAGFNLGVEIGQIGIVLLAWPALGWAARATAPTSQRWARDLATAGLCGLGCFWLLERAFSF